MAILALWANNTLIHHFHVVFVVNSEPAVEPALLRALCYTYNLARFTKKNSGKVYRFGSKGKGGHSILFFEFQTYLFG